MVNTKERPIALTAQEVNAVLAGNKTQYRVPVLTAKEIDEGFEWDFSAEGDSAVCIKEIDDERQEVLLKPCPFGAIGDRLWVQEDHARQRRWEEKFSLTGAHYFADGPLTLDVRHDAGMLEKHSASDMPRWASRLLLEITDIRIERLNDISEQDAIAQGIKHIHADPKDRVGPNHFTKSNGWYHCSRPTAAEVFKEMHTVSDDYDKYGENPWVWVIEFKVIKENDDD